MSQQHRTRSLWWCGALHAFTHIYHVALMPLYLLIQQDFHLEKVGRATLLVTAMMAAYFVPSYPMGMLADRVSRKKLLGIGLLINSLGFVALGLAPNYSVALVAVIVAGFGGSFYHPAATAMVARLYPVGTGKALGLAGMGASIGFFVGPIYTGWRAQYAGWRAPIIELGCLGVIGAIAFWILADEDRVETEPQTKSYSIAKLFPAPALWLFFIAASFCFSLRDFAGSSMGTLGSLFLQQAHGLSLRDTGVALSGIFIMSLVSNPLFGGLSDRGRIRWTALVLIIAALMVAVFPHLPRSAVVPAYMIYGFFFMASYPMIEAALMESVPDAVRGRVFGFFITIGGLVGNISHWVAGRWVQQLGPAATSPQGFYNIYLALACFILLSLLGLPCLHAIRKREHLDVPSPGVLRAPGSIVMQNPEV